MDQGCEHIDTYMDGDTSTGKLEIKKEADEYWVTVVNVSIEL